MRLVLASALLLLTACPVPPEAGCLPRAGFSFPTTVGPGALPETIVVTPGMLSVEAPQVTCIPSDPTIVTVTATISGGGQPARTVPSTIALSTSTDSRVNVDVSGVQPGQYSLQIFIEPTIAAVNKDLIVAIDRSSPPSPRLEPSCPGRHARTALGTSVCSEGSLTFAILQPDGGAVRLPGTAATLANDVLWLEGQRSGNAFVERHVERSPGRFERTHVIPLESVTVQAADEAHVWAGTLLVTATEDGGYSTQRTVSSEQATLRIVDQGRGLEFRSGQELCEMDGGCWSLRAIGSEEVAVAGSARIWFEQESATGLINGLVRPLSALRSSVTSRYSLPQARVQQVFGQGGRLPSPAVLALKPEGSNVMYVERADGVFELWRPEPGWVLRDATDSIVEFEVAPGQTAVFFR
ncbi:MAG: hypothetical protein GQE15_32160 [Archangiaceae bacterium]|nr:hypothetical protein [Archangiaceae bacterium]